MSEINNEVSSTESSAEVSDVKETEAPAKTSEVEMDEELSNDLDNSYESYMEEGKNYSKKESKLETDDEIETEETEDLDHELDNTYDSYLEDNKAQKVEINEDNPRENTENSEENLDSELDNKYNEYIDEGKESDNVESNVEQIKCRNENFEGQEHPETGVPFNRRQVEVDGKQYEVVVPEFESKYDAQLPEDKYKSPDREQFKECNNQLKEEVSNNKDFREQFDDEQLEQIENGDTPDGYTWHHDAEAGKMQLVDTETHQKTGHTGGRSIWGGGNENR